MYTIENLVDDDIIFPFEYGASASEMWSLLLNFPRNRENLEDLDENLVEEQSRNFELNSLTENELPK